jgi:hypothetical protein
MRFRIRGARGRQSMAGYGHMRRRGKFLASQYRFEAHRTESDMVERAWNRNLRAMQALTAIRRIVKKSIVLH